MKVKIILDANFLITLFEIPKIDIYSEVNRIIENKNYELIVPSFIFEELEKLFADGKEKLKNKIELALKFARSLKETKFELNENEKIDDAIIRAAKQLNAIVATNDKELRRKLRKKEIPVIFVRQKSHLVLEGYI